MKPALFVVGIALLIAIELGAPAREPFDHEGTPAPTSREECTDQSAEEARTKVTRPADLLLLEMPDRAIWQQPEQIMDQLNIADSSWVADVGAGSGWFTIWLSLRVDPYPKPGVPPRGKVFAQDVQKEMLTAIDRRVRRKGLRNVETRLGNGISPNLPLHALDAVLVVDVYSEVSAGDRVPFLRNLADSLKPRGRIGIVNHKAGAGGPGPCAADRVPRSIVERDAREAELRVLPTMVDLRYQYLVVLAK
jgi:SAM-dependent methyltransferase